MKEYYLKHKNQTVVLAEKRKLTIGRKGHGADIEIEDTSASRKHGEIYKNGKRLYKKYE